MKTMPSTQVDRCIQLSLLSILGGIGFWFVGLHITGFVLFGLGVMGMSFTDWKTEPGLWMLAFLYFAVFGSLYVVSLYFEIAEVISGKAQGNAMLVVDATLGTGILGFMARFLWAVFRRNRAMLTKTQDKTCR